MSLRAWLELARVSNVPTVATNALVGAALGRTDGPYPWAAAGAAAGAASLLYVGGMILNDACDARHDARVGAARPIPAGRVGRGAAFAVAAGLMAVGVLVATWSEPTALVWAIALAVAIVAYDVLHHAVFLAVVFMGVCRALVYPLGAALTGMEVTTALGTVAVTMGAYVLVLTIVARREHDAHPARRRAAAVVLPVLLVAPVFAIDPRFPGPAILVWFLVLAWAGWCARRVWRTPANLRGAVMGWIALIALADAWFLALLDRPEVALVAAGLFVLTILGHRRILGT